jgi:PAS domain S-box-containing protein
MDYYKSKILIVDDKPTNLRFLSKILSEQGYKVQRAICGQLALNGAMDAPPDLILLDVMMPRIDGYEVCQRLKSTPQTSEIPVIFLSALNEAIDKVKAFEVGGVDYITKPFQVEEVLARIEKQLTIQRLSKQLQEQNFRLEQEIEIRKQAEAALQEKATQLHNQNIVLMELAKNKALHQGDLKVALKEITEAAAHTLGIERVSVWLFDETQTHIQCLDLFEQRLNQHSEGIELSAVNYPNYFQALAKDQLITADDAHTDPNTQEFSEFYLTPLGISSMLDAPIRLGGQTVGVLCNEQIGKKHHWTPEEQNFARSIADLVSLVLEAQERKRAETALVERVRLAELDADVGMALSQGKNLQDMLGRCASALVKHLDAAFTRIWTLNEAESMLELQASAGMYAQSNGVHSRVPVGQFKIGLIAQQRQPHIDFGFSIADFGLGDITEESEVSESNEGANHPKSKTRPQDIVRGRQNPKWQQGMEAFVGYPLILEDRLVGVLALFARHQLTEATLQAMASIANGIALGIDRFWTEEQLRESEERWQLALKGNNDGIWDWNIITGETFRSSRFMELLGFEDPERGNSNDEWTTLIHPDDFDRVMAANQDYLNRKIPHYAVEHRMRCKDGSYKWVTSRGQALWDEHGQPIRMVGSTRDITPRKIAEEKLKKSEASLAAAQRVAHVGNWEFDVNIKKITWSEELFHIFGLDPTGPELTYIQHLRQIHPDDRSLLRQTIEQMIATGKAEELDYRIVRSDGQIRHLVGRGEAIFNQQGQVLRLFGTALDITERKQAEQALRQSEAREREKSKELEVTLKELKRTQSQLIQTEKMSSLGRMVAGVAHEINNPVSFIYGNLTPAREYFQDLLSLLKLYQRTYPHPIPEIRQLGEEIDLNFLVEDWQHLINSMQMGAERIHEIVRSLKIFSRLDESELKPVDIHEGIDNTLVILQHRLRAEGVSAAGRVRVPRSEIKVIKDYGQLPQVTCYASQLNQVFMNLLSNAIDALDNQTSPRVITITTEVVSGQWSVVSGKEKRATDFVVIRIADNGCGMSEDVQQKIFDPFFTTKPVGSGTGLGLALSYQIVVEKHGGHLSCVSTLSQGTELLVKIPVNN